MKEKFIEVYDNILPKYLEDSYEKDITSNSYPFLYGTNITYGGAPDRKYSPAFTVPLCTNNPDFPKSNLNYINQVVHRLSVNLNFSIINIIRTKVLLQIPSINITSDDIHVDLDIPHLVCLYYINDSDGDTILFDDNNNEIKRVTPKKGRIVFFDGSIKHCSSPPTKTHRAIINFNILIEKFG